MKIKMKNVINFFSVLFITGLILSCSSEDGEDGAMGPQGVAGTDGTDGEDGTANVIYSDWFPSQFPDDIDGTNYVFSVAAPDLTAEIVEKGLVLVYGRFYSGDDIGVIFQLPHIFPFSQQFYTHSFTTPPASNAMRVFIILLSMDNTPIGSSLFEEYRYVIISGGTPAGKSATSKDYSKMTYEEIAELFNIPE